MRVLPEYCMGMHVFATLTRPENPADAISEVLNSKIFLHGGTCLQIPQKSVLLHANFRMLRSIVYAQPVPGQLIFFGAQFSRELARLYEYSYWAQFLL